MRDLVGTSSPPTTKTQERKEEVKHFIDGDQICVTKDDFINLQVSPAVFIPCSSETGMAIESGGILNMAFGDLRAVYDLLNDGGGEFKSISEASDPAHAEYNHLQMQAGLPPLRV